MRIQADGRQAFLVLALQFGQLAGTVCEIGAYGASLIRHGRLLSGKREALKAFPDGITIHLRIGELVAL